MCFNTYHLTPFGVLTLKHRPCLSAVGHGVAWRGETPSGARAQYLPWRSLLRQRPPDRTRAQKLIVTHFSRPVRDNDEGYLDINLALNALESAYIQLTGKADAKGKFFPQMRERLRQRGHKIADYDVCL